MEQAENGITALREYVDSLVVIPNERIKLVSEQRITLANAFEVADDVLRQGVQSISQLIKVPGLVNLDFADVTSIMKDAGYAHMGVGRAEGKDRSRTGRPVRPWPAPCWKPLSMARAACLSTSPVPRIWILRTSTRRRRSSPARLIRARPSSGARPSTRIWETPCA